LCNSELRSFQQSLAEFTKRGVAVAAISVDSPEESQRLCREQGYTFPFLSDPEAAAIRQYGVLHAGGGEDGRDIASPAEFLVDASGRIRWVNLTEDIRVRARPEVVLEIVDRELR
jgi:peroxiredoxin